MAHRSRLTSVLVDVPKADHDKAVRDRDADVVLRIPADYATAWTRGEPAQFEVIFDASQQNSGTPTKRLEGMLKRYGSEQGTLRLLARGLAPSIAAPMVATSTK